MATDDKWHGNKLLTNMTAQSKIKLHHRPKIKHITHTGRTFTCCLTQVECQMGVLTTHTCDFYVFTLKDEVSETISFDKNVWEIICSKASLFNERRIVPEMMLHDIKDKSVSEKTSEELLDNVCNY